jgi:hypothetical protein
MKKEIFLANFKIITKKKCNRTKVSKTNVANKIHSGNIENESLRSNFHLIDIDEAFIN